MLAHPSSIVKFGMSHVSSEVHTVSGVVLQKPERKRDGREVAPLTLVYAAMPKSVLTNAIWPLTSSEHTHFAYRALLPLHDVVGPLSRAFTNSLAL